MSVETELRQPIQEISDEELISLQRLHFMRVCNSEGYEHEINRIDLAVCERELLARMGGRS